MASKSGIAPPTRQHRQIDLKSPLKNAQKGPVKRPPTSSTGFSPDPKHISKTSSNSLKNQPNSESSLKAPENQKRCQENDDSFEDLLGDPGFMGRLLEAEKCFNKTEKSTRSDSLKRELKNSAGNNQAKNKDEEDLEGLLMDPDFMKVLDSKPQSQPNNASNVKRRSPLKKLDQDLDFEQTHKKPGTKILKNDDELLKDPDFLKELEAADCDLNEALGSKHQQEGTKENFESPKVTGSNRASEISDVLNQTQRNLEIEDLQLDDSFEELLNDPDLMRSIELAEKKEKDKTRSLSQLPHKDLILISWKHLESGAVELHCQSRNDPKSEFCVFLEGFWAQTPLTTEMPLRVFGTFSSPPPSPKIDSSKICPSISVSDSENFLVIFPDVLVQATTVASGTFCRRRTVLNERFRGYEPGNKYMIVGSIVHQLFQSALELKKLPTREWLEAQAKAQLDNPNLLYGMEEKPEELLDQIRSYFSQIIDWITRHIFNRQPLRVSSNSTENNPHEIVGIRDIEENIWCSKFGLRGKVDVSLEVSPVNSRKSNQISRKRVLPLELKTGKSSKGVDHQGQVLLYTLMLSSLEDVSSSDGSKSGSPVTEGLLLYLKDGATHPIKLRNDLAFCLGQRDFRLLPEPINDARSCGFCPQITTCAIWQETFEKDRFQKSPLPLEHAMKTLVPSALAHLKPEYLEYFKQWTNWIFMEWQASKDQRSQLTDVWNKSSTEREKKNEGLARMKLCQVQESAHSFFLVMRKINSNEGIPFGVVSVGETVVGSSETRNHTALFMGSVRHISDKEIKIMVDKRPREEVMGDEWRLDKYESFATFQINLTNLARLMENTPRSQHLRELIIEKRPPTFLEKLPSGLIKQLKPSVKGMNGAQVKAIVRALMAQDYLLIKGFPGAGKTSTIVGMIEALMELGKSVIVTAYTHSAVDNILLKLSQKRGGKEEGMLILGSGSQVSPLLKHLIKDASHYESAKVVGVTSLQAASHQLFFKRREWDFCIVDEASLSLQSALLGPLFSAKTFILVGDPNQLAPLVLSNQARKEGMGDCLFSRLESVSSPKSLVTLHLQYRMNREIFRLSNELFYSGEMKCAADSVADATLTLPTNENAKPSKPWLQKCLSPKIENSVLVLDTSKLGKSDHKYLAQRMGGGGQIGNRGEAELIKEITTAFQKAGVKGTEMGVVCFYRYQIKIIKETLGERNAEGMEIQTADWFQKNSELLQNWRRINVALTRAKHKLILVGHLEGLKQYPAIQKLSRSLPSDQIFTL